MRELVDSRDSMVERALSPSRRLWRMAAAAALIVGTGCTGTPAHNPDAGPSEDANGSDVGSPPVCGGRARETFAFEFLAIPELAAAPGDAFDVDDTGDTCAVPDWPYGLDNHLPDNLRDADAELLGVDIRSAIDGIVVCDDSNQCGSAFRLERDSGTSCSRYSVLTDEGSVIASGVGYGDSGSLGTLSLAFLVDGQRVRFRLSEATFRLRSDQSRILLGGYLNADDNRAFATDLCAIATNTEGQCNVDGFVDLWTSQGDILIAGQCDGLSVAVTLSRVTTP